MFSKKGKMYSRNFRKIQRETPVLKSNKVTGLQARKAIKSDSSLGVLL